MNLYNILCLTKCCKIQRKQFYAFNRRTIFIQRIIYILYERNIFDSTNYLYIQQNNYFDSTNYLHIQRNNFFDATNYLYIQRKNCFHSTNYLYIQPIIYVFNGDFSFRSSKSKDKKLCAEILKIGF